MKLFKTKFLVLLVLIGGCFSLQRRIVKRSNNYIGFPQSFSSIGATYHISTIPGAKQLSFNVHFHGEALLLLWKIQTDSTTDIIYVNNGVSIQKDEWVQIQLLLDDPPGVDPVKLIFQVFNKKNTSKVGIDDIEFKTETEGTTESFITAYKYRNEVERKGYRNTLTSMGIPLPKILYPFANAKREFIVADYGEGQLNLDPTADLEWEVSSHNTLGIPNHSMELKKGRLTVDISSVTSTTILFHYYVTTSGKIWTAHGSSSSNYFELAITENFYLAIRSGENPTTRFQKLLKVNNAYYIGLIFNQDKIRLIINNKLLHSEDFIMFPIQTLSFLSETGGHISCFQVHERGLSAMEIKALELCPNLQDPQFYTHQCKVRIFPVLDCGCGWRRTKTSDCKDVYPRFKDSILYMTCDDVLSSLIGSFVPEPGVDWVKQSSVVNEAICFDMTSLATIGSFSHDCLKDFTGCPSGYVFNFWYHTGDFTTYGTEHEVLNFGEFKWFVTYQLSSADGVLIWKSENNCRLTFPMPWKAWGYFSLFVNRTNFQIFYNGEKMLTYGNCTVPALRSEQFEIKVGKTGQICLDEISIVPVQSMEEIAEFYLSLTGKARDMNIHNKKSSVGLILTADFSEITENDLKQNTPSYPTYTMLIGLIKNTIKEMHNQARLMNLVYSTSTIRTITINKITKNVVKQNNFYDLDLSLEYEDFTYADRHLFFIADYFVFQQRTYSFQLYDELFWENSVVSYATTELTVADDQPDPSQTLVEISSSLNDLQKSFHKGYTMVMNVFGSANITVTFRPMGTSSFTFAAPPYRWVTLLVYPATHGGHGPPTSATIFTKKSVNLVPPNIIRCAAEPGIGELKVSWETYDFDNWSGDSIGYVVYWKKITDDHDENNINLHDYYSRNVKHPLEYVRTVLNDLNNGISSHSHTMHNLGVFTLNSVLLSTKNEEGEGSYEKVTCRTGPGAPDGGPIFKSAFLTSNDTAVVTWIEIDFSNKTHLEFVNDYDYIEFEVSLQRLPLDSSSPAVSSTEPKGKNNFTFTSDHFSVFRVGVAIKNNGGTGPEQEFCVALGEDVPTAGPTLLEMFDSSPWSINLTVGEVPLPDENGIITHYNITYEPQELTDPVKSIITTIDVRPTEDILIWDHMSNIEVNCSYFLNNPQPLSSKPWNFSISGLFPFTEYEIKAYPCTRYGCSVVDKTIKFKTAPTFPSCPLNSTMSNTSSTSLMIKWTNLTHQCLHGTLDKYFVMVYESEIQPPFYGDNRTSTIEELEFTGLKKYWNYSAVIFTVNQIGRGPPSNIVWALTEEDIPEGPPTSIVFEVLNSTAISFTLSPPERTVVNGIITQYTVYYNTTEDTEASQNFFSNQTGPNTTVIVTGLRKFFDHYISVTAHTRIGEGPRSNNMIVKTHEDVPSVAPPNFVVTSTSHENLTLKWTDIPVLSAHGIMRNFSVSCAGKLANESLHFRDEIVPYDANVAPEDYMFEVLYLFPHTVYNCSIVGCTTPGCGMVTPEIMMITQDYYPSGVVQSINQTMFEEKESLYINFTDLLPMEKRGAIIHYKISLNKIENYWDTFNDSTRFFSVPPDAFTWSVNGLDNYTEYVITVTANTIVGPGPSRNVTYRTAVNVPTSSPSVYYINNISSSALNVKWNELSDSASEGPIEKYIIYFRPTDEHILCNFYDNCTGPNSTFVNESTTEVDLLNLKLHWNYTVWVAAETEAGIGPGSDIVMAMTDSFVNGNWTIWTQWGSCDQSCGLGISTRVRWCTNPEPFAGGNYCEGDPKEFVECNDFPCPAMYLSEGGVDCEDTCKQVNDTFGCFNRINTHESNALFETSRDPTNYTLELNITCKPTLNRLYTKTLHPSFDISTSQCEGYLDAPLKINCTAEEPINANTRRLCYCIDIETMGYEEWAPWSPCSKSCDVGTKARFRNCLMEKGCNKIMDQNDCNIFQCPIHGNWGQWTEYGECDRTCGFGKRKKTRKCDNPKPKNNGDYCVGTDVEIVSGCNPFPCPIHGVWGEWFTEEFCKQPCGGAGHRRKYRYCNSPVPKYDGRNCSGSSEILLSCNRNRVCKKEITVNFVAKLLDFEWEFHMIYPNRPEFKMVENNISTACMKVLNKTVGADNILSVKVNNLRRGSVISNFTITYKYVPSIEVLVVQNAIDKVGKLHELNITHVDITSNDVPNHPPDFKAVSRTPFTIDVEWKHVSNNTLNGKMYLYYIYYRQLDHSDRQWEVAGTSGTNLTLIDLKPKTLYGMRISVSIEEGNGIASMEKQVWTIEGVPYIAPPNYNHDVLDFSTVYLSWNAISIGHVPGILRGYQITYRQYFDNQTLVTKTAPDLLQRTLTNLIPFTWYWFEIAGYTDAGLGPDNLIVLKTPPGPPIIPPPNVTVYQRYSTEFIRLTWEEIPERYQRGYMKGYKISYQLIRQSGRDAPIGSPVTTLEFDRFVFGHEIINLKPYADYEIKIFGYADVGDGPYSKHFASTCACPEIVYSNFLHQPPFVITNKRNTSDVRGFFPDLMTSILREVCVHCDAYKPSIYYDRTQLGYPSKKTSMNMVKEGVDRGTHMNFPFFGQFEIEKYEGFYPYIGIIYSQGVAMIVKDVKEKSVGMVNIMLAISKAWSVLFVGILMCSICGWILWFTEQTSESSDMMIDRSLIGSLQGLWVAYVTMTTVGYGDFVPTTNASKVVMMAWVLIGLVTMGVITGVISSGMTVGDQEVEIKLYGTTTATLPDSFERRLAILRNAVVDKSNYTTVLDLFEAVASGQVVIALVDATVAAGYEKKMDDYVLRADKIINTNSGYGITLSGGLEPLEYDIRAFIASNRPLILEYAENHIPRLIPKPLDPEVKLIPKNEIVLIMIYMGKALGVICFFAFILSLMRAKKNQMVKPQEPFTSGKFYEEMMKIVEEFNDSYNNRLEKIEKSQFEDVKNLQQLQKNYGRLLQRAGYRKETIQESFDKKKKKDIRTIVKNNRRKKLEEMIAKTSEDGYYGVCNEDFKQ